MSAREIPDLYAANNWPAIVTRTDGRQTPVGLIRNVTDDGFDVVVAARSATFRHDEVIEIYPADTSA